MIISLVNMIYYYFNAVLLEESVQTLFSTLQLLFLFLCYCFTV